MHNKLSLKGALLGIHYVYYEEVSVKKKRIFFYNLARYASERVNMGFCPTETLFE